MTPEERRALLEESRDPARRASLRAAADATRAWDAAHPLAFGAYVDFLSEFWTMFGLAPPRGEIISGAGLSL
jgi:hypothetical protein